MKKRIVSLILSTVMAVSLLSGCGNKQETEAVQEENAAEVSEKKAEDSAEVEAGELSGELNIVHYLSEPQKIAALDELVAGFEEEYPNVKINQESTTLENYQDVLNSISLQKKEIQKKWKCTLQKKKLIIKFVEH